MVESKIIEIKKLQFLVSEVLARAVHIFVFVGPFLKMCSHEYIKNTSSPYDKKTAPVLESEMSLKLF
jgi:hypothetical protein